MDIQEKWAAERKQALDTNFKNLQCIKSVLSPTLDNLGLCANYEQSENSHDSNVSLILTDDTLPDFRASVSCFIRQNKQMAATNFWFERSIWTPAKNAKYEGQGYSARYEFKRFIEGDEIKALGFESANNYAGDILYELRKEFSATKNIKLILNDIIPALKIYRSIVQMVEPRINQQQTKDNNTLKLMSDLAHACGYPEPDERHHEYGVHLIGGRVTVSEYGTIKLEKEIDADTMHKLITEHKKSKTRGEA